MTNLSYEKMIANAHEYISNQDPDNQNQITLNQFGNVLSVCFERSNKSIVDDIINFDRDLIFPERIKLFYNIWGEFQFQITGSTLQHKPIAFYFNMQPIDNPEFKEKGKKLTKDELYNYIMSGFVDVYDNGSLEQKIIEIMNYNKVPTKLKQIQLDADNKKLRLNEYKF